MDHRGIIYQLPLTAAAINHILQFPELSNFPARDLVWTWRAQSLAA